MKDNRKLLAFTILSAILIAQHYVSTMCMDSTQNNSIILIKLAVRSIPRNLKNLEAKPPTEFNSYVKSTKEYTPEWGNFYLT